MDALVALLATVDVSLIGIVVGALCGLLGGWLAATKSKPHELEQAKASVTEAETHAFTAFMTEARQELNRLRDELALCEEKHVESAVERDALRDEIHELRRLLDELRTQTGNDPQETPT